MRTTAIVALVVLAFASPATALARSVSTETASVHRAISWQRSRTWHWQDVARVKRSPTIRGAARPHSTGYLHWVEHRWQARRLAAYKLAHRPTYRTLASTGGIAHAALWSCIHGDEGGWHQPSYAVDSNGTPLYWGGLQMTSPWGKGAYYVYRADLLSPYEQMRKAELGYRASGYSTTWLMGQWNHPDCLGYA